MLDTQHFAQTHLALIPSKVSKFSSKPNPANGFFIQNSVENAMYLHIISRLATATSSHMTLGHSHMEMKSGCSLR